MTVRIIKAMMESETRGEGRAALAKRLGIGIETLDSLQKDYELANGEGSWQRLIHDSRATLDTLGASWDQIEILAVEKLAEHVRAGRVVTVGELLTVARVANQAARRGPLGARPLGPGFQPIGGSATLPGSDGIVMELRLSRIAAEQLESGPPAAATIETEFERINSPIEIRALIADEKESTA
jgi:hypothetical protein